MNNEAERLRLEQVKREELRIQEEVKDLTFKPELCEKSRQIADSKRKSEKLQNNENANTPNTPDSKTKTVTSPGINNSIPKSKVNPNNVKAGSSTVKMNADRNSTSLNSSKPTVTPTTPITKPTSSKLLTKQNGSLSKSETPVNSKQSEVPAPSPRPSVINNNSAKKAAPIITKLTTNVSSPGAATTSKIVNKLDKPHHGSKSSGTTMSIPGINILGATGPSPSKRILGGKKMSKENIIVSENSADEAVSANISSNSSLKQEVEVTLSSIVDDTYLAAENIDSSANDLNNVESTRTEDISNTEQEISLMESLIIDGVDDSEYPLPDLLPTTASPIHTSHDESVVEDYFIISSNSKN